MAKQTYESDLKALVSQYPMECWLMYHDRHESPEWTQKLVLFDFLESVGACDWRKKELKKLAQAVSDGKLDPCLETLGKYVRKPDVNELLNWCSSENGPWSHLNRTADARNTLYTYETSIASGAIDDLMERLWDTQKQP